MEKILISSDAVKFGASNYPGNSRFESIFLRVLEAYCSNAEFAKAYPASIVNIALETTLHSLQVLSEGLQRHGVDFYEGTQPDPDQTEINFPKEPIEYF